MYQRKSRSRANCTEHTFFYYYYNYNIYISLISFNLMSIWKKLVKLILELQVLFHIFGLNYNDTCLPKKKLQWYLCIIFYHIYIFINYLMIGKHFHLYGYIVFTSSIVRWSNNQNLCIKVMQSGSFLFRNFLWWFNDK